MSKKKLLEFGLKEADAFQKNFKIIFDRLVRGYKSMMGKDPEGLDLLKVKMEARQKALDTTKVVNQKGLTLDPLSIPSKLKTALEALYGHYEKTYELWEKEGIKGLGIGTSGIDDIGCFLCIYFMYVLYACI